MRLVSKLKQLIRSLDDFTLAFILGLVFYTTNGITTEVKIHSEQQEWIVMNAIVAVFYIMICYIFIRLGRMILKNGKKE